MKSFLKGKRNIALLLAALFLLLPQAAFAAVNVTAQATQPSVQAGDTVEVTLTLQGKSMATAEGVFTYDPKLLTYKESDGGASDGFVNMVSAAKGGSDTLSARIRFTAAGAGTANIAFSIEKVLGYDGKDQGSAQASVSVTVAAPAPTPAPTPIDYAAKGVAAQNVQGASENLYIWRSLENVTLPSGYTETTLDYHGETIAAATAADSDAPTLLYLSNAAGDKGSYYIFNAQSDKLYVYQTVSSVSKSYIILEPDGSVTPPDGFTQTTLTIGETQYTAWKAQDAQGDVYLLYARNPDGEKGYYVYNPADESMQRYAVMPARPVEPTLPPEAAAPTPAPAAQTPASTPTKGITLSNAVFYVMCGGNVLLILGAILLAVSYMAENKRRKRRAAARKAGRTRIQDQNIEQ